MIAICGRPGRPTVDTTTTLVYRLFNFMRGYKDIVTYFIALITLLKQENTVR